MDEPENAREWYEERDRERERERERARKREKESKAGFNKAVRNEWKWKIHFFGWWQWKILQRKYSQENVWIRLFITAACLWHNFHKIIIRTLYETKSLVLWVVAVSWDGGNFQFSLIRVSNTNGLCALMRMSIVVAISHCLWTKSIKPNIKSNKWMNLPSI